MHPAIGLAIVSFIALFFLVRSSWILPLLVAGILILPNIHRVDVASINMNSHRLLVIFALFASLTRNSVRTKWQTIDSCVLLWFTAVIVAMMTQKGLQEGLISSLTYIGDCVFAYLVARREVRSIRDIERISTAVAVSALVVVVPALVESNTRWNPWSVFGGIREFPTIRQGLVRAQGNSPHPILFGTQWALMSIVIAISGSQGKPSLLKKAGLVASFVISVTSFSSTALSVLLIGMFLLPLTILRNYLRWILGACFLSLIPLHFMMNGPVWSLFAKLNLFSGSTGWHRFALIDRAISRFDEWALFGQKSTAHWGPGLWDMTNSILLNGMRGGLLGMLAFLSILGIAFLQSIRRAEGRLGARLNQQSTVGWGLCVFMMSAFMGMTSVSFLGGIWILLFVIFAAAVSLGNEARPAPSPGKNSTRETGPRADSPD